ncbi:MAG TPA: rhodanese-like domain-containing protein [Xanthomonadales bacterium]|nr:rhodanese-like domain-containing protein [Xanthomonadales bacterium]
MKTWPIALACLLLLAPAAGLPQAAADDPTKTAPAAEEIQGDLEAARQSWALIEDGALVIDVRSAGEFSGGHVDGALNIAHTDIEALAAAIGPDLNRSVVLYCGSGRRSGLAIAGLEELGYEALYNATGYDALQATQP